MVYNDRRVELIGHSGVKGAVSAKNRAIIKNHSKVCYSKCNITPPSVDTTPPVITLNGDSNITVTQGESYNELGATAVDDVDGNVSVTISGSVDTSTVGVYTITYTATDSSNNSATITRTVNVEEPEATLISITVSPNPIGLRVNRSGEPHSPKSKIMGEASFVLNTR